MCLPEMVDEKKELKSFEDVDKKPTFPIYSEELVSTRMTLEDMGFKFD